MKVDLLATQVNPCREHVKETSWRRKNSPKWIRTKSTLKKPLGEGRIHLSEYLLRAR